MAHRPGKRRHRGPLRPSASLILGNFIAWIPVAALAGLLIVTAFADRPRAAAFHRVARHRLRFPVVAVVVIVAMTIGLIAASAVGVPWRSFSSCANRSGFGRSPRSGTRSPDLAPSGPRCWCCRRRGDQAVVVELQKGQPVLRHDTAAVRRSRAGTALAPVRHSRSEARAVGRRHRRAHMLNQIRDVFAERDAHLLLSKCVKTCRTGAICANSVQTGLPTTATWCACFRTRTMPLPGSRGELENGLCRRRGASHATGRDGPLQQAQGRNA